MLQPVLETINPNEVLLYLGYTGGEVPSGIEAEISECSKAVTEAARPKLTYRIFEVNPDGASAQKADAARAAHAGISAGPDRSGIPSARYLLRNVNFPLLGEDIARHLSECTHAVVMAATLGPDVETLLMRTQVQDMAKALIMDSCASTAIENVCDNIEAQLRAQYEAEGRYLTDRFSPGYGDMPISQQPDICGLLDTRRRIGLSVSRSGIMIPRKSVTAFMGVSDVPKPRRSRGCVSCTMFRTCTIRKDGHFCGNGGYE